MTVTQARTRLALHGELDLAAVPYLERALEVEERRGSDRLDLDLADLDFIDVAGLHALLEAARRSDRRGRLLVLHNPQPSVRRLLELTAIDRSVDVVFD